LQEDFLPATTLPYQLYGDMIYARQID